MDFLRRSLLSFGLIVAVSGLSSAPGAAEPAETITVASTTSTEQSGLFKELLPKFTQASGIGVKVVALGTGQALDAARRGDAEVALVHDTAAEEKFVGEGWSTKRYPVMYNDFVIVGPKDDPARVAGASVVEALRKIAAAKALFVSRGDRSGTHSAELRYWKEAGLDLGAVRGDWYKDVGQGMGPALNTASAANAYVLSDRGTWLSFKNRGDLKILVEGDKRLFNQYGVMVVNPEKHPQVKAKAAQAFVDWLVSAPGQAAIAAYRINGEQLFFPNAEAQ
ncbi:MULTISPECIES: substrate-binding domain-containing protein [unclassified Methylobacterium]|uniref:substrate-binding domain-containing protein n=1 Tax=unclassified Methylobacterium TaxID=2615210 RepID=UPI0003711C14|nr:MULTISPECIES: substrate-binding domain-containing protein [unclassified Methylobacterium]KQP42149.1 tungsten ABC transporter substrate-binding protein [Methylobacterium sp. Leaf106]